MAWQGWKQLKCSQPRPIMHDSRYSCLVQRVDSAKVVFYRTRRPVSPRDHASIPRKTISEDDLPHTSIAYIARPNLIMMERNVRIPSGNRYISCGYIGSSTPSRKLSGRLGQ